MKLGLINREAIRAISPALEAELDSLMATIGATFQREHYWDGRHSNITLDSLTQNPNTDQNTTPAATKIGNIIREESGHWWLQGPWLLDDPGSHVAGLRPPDIAAETHNDYAPAGIDNAVMLELDPLASGAVILTGIRCANPAQKRLLAIRNRDSGGGTVTLKHQDTGSLEPYRFRLPNEEDIVLADGQIAWMYYDPGQSNWALFVTPQQSGGLATMGGITFTTINITKAQLEASNTSPVTLVSGTANKIIFPVAAYVVFTQTAVYTNNPTATIRFNLTTDIAAMDSIPGQFTVGGSHVEDYLLTPVAVAPLTDGEMKGASLNFQLNADLTGTGSAAVAIDLAYFLFP